MQLLQPNHREGSFYNDCNSDTGNMATSRAHSMEEAYEDCGMLYLHALAMYSQRDVKWGAQHGGKVYIYRKYGISHMLRGGTRRRETCKEESLLAIAMYRISPAQCGSFSTPRSCKVLPEQDKNIYMSASSFHVKENIISNAKPALCNGTQGVEWLCFTSPPWVLSLLTCYSGRIKCWYAHNQQHAYIHAWFSFVFNEQKIHNF